MPQSPKLVNTVPFVEESPSIEEIASIMSSQASRRLTAISNQLSPKPAGDTFDGIPLVKKVGPDASQPRVKDKVVIITGANSPLGIGRAAAHQFASHGARAVYICDLDGSHLDTHKREITALYPAVDVHTRQFDAADDKAVKAVVDDALAQYGRLDVFFGNAGTTGAHKVFTDISDEEFMDILRVNTLSTFLATKHASAGMLKTSAAKPSPSGSIILTASVAGLRSNAGSTPYSASKAAVINLAQTAAFQLAGTNIRVNSLCPGLIETGMTAVVFEAARARGTEKKVGQLNPLKRGGVADEIARVALFLGSDDSSYVNGQAWAVDGGLSAGLPYVQNKIA